MFPLPSITSLPVPSGVILGAIDVPTIAAVIGWFLFAALVGSALGILREYGRSASDVAVADHGDVNVVLHPADLHHREAA